MLNQEHDKILKDGGFASRKFLAFVFTSILMTLAFIASGQWPALGMHLATFISGITAVLLLYLGGNITGKATIFGKAIQKVNPESSQSSELAQSNKKK